MVIICLALILYLAIGVVIMAMVLPDLFSFAPRLALRGIVLWPYYIFGKGFDKK